MVLCVCVGVCLCVCVCVGVCVCVCVCAHGFVRRGRLRVVTGLRGVVEAPMNGSLGVW